MASKKRTGRTAAISDVDAALAVLQRLAMGEPDDVPEGFRTVKQWAAAWNLHHHYAGRLLTDGIAAGAVERQSYRVLTGNRQMLVPHYRVKVP